MLPKQKVGGFANCLSNCWFGTKNLVLHCSLAANCLAQLPPATSLSPPRILAAPDQDQTLEGLLAPHQVHGLQGRWGVVVRRVLRARAEVLGEGRGPVGGTPPQSGRPPTPKLGPYTNSLMCIPNNCNTFVAKATRARLRMLEKLTFFE